MSEEKLEFKITKDAKGNDIELTNLSVEATNSLILMLQSMKDIIVNTPGAENAKIQVVKGSATVMTIAPPEVIQSFQEDFQNVLDKKETNASIVAPWRQLQNLFQANGLRYEANFYTKSIKISVEKQIKKATEFRAKPIKKQAKYELEFVKGKLIELGGKNPNIHILKNGVKTAISCTEIEAIKVNQFIYKEIEISIRKKIVEDNIEYSFCDFYSDSKYFDEFQELITDSIQKDIEDFLFILHFKIKSFLDDKNYGVVLKIFRLFNHISTDVNILKTILIITKSFSDNEQLKEPRANLYHLLKSKLEQQTKFTFPK